MSSGGKRNDSDRSLGKEDRRIVEGKSWMKPTEPPEMHMRPDGPPADPPPTPPASSVTGGPDGDSSTGGGDPDA